MRTWPPSQRIQIYATTCLIVVGLIGCVAAAMPPHPDVLEQIRQQIAGGVPLPDHLNRDVLLASGIDRPVVGALPSGPTEVLALLVDFSDNVAAVAAGSFDNLMYAAAASVNHYFSEVSYGNVSIVCTAGVDLPGTVGWTLATQTPTQTYAYYTAGLGGMLGAWPNNAARMVYDVVSWLDTNTAIDFAPYDNDNDGFVDCVVVIHAGTGAEFSLNPNDMWSHKWSIYGGSGGTQAGYATNDGVTVDVYVTVPEFWAQPGDMTIGVSCHELGHGLFNLPDLYDRDYSSNGIGHWSLMAGGSWNGPGGLGSSPAHPDAWTRIQMGFTTPVTVATNLQNANIPQVETNATGAIYRLWTGGATGNEYFLIENRQQVGYDAGLLSSGLCVWHVDENMDVWTKQNDFECDQLYNWLCSPDHYLVALEQADAFWDLEHATDSGDAGDPYPGSTGNRAFNFTSAPNSSSYYSSSATGVGVTSISNSGATMTADLEVFAVTKGDVNGDGVINVIDVRLCLQIATGVIPGTPQQRAAADVDGDGDVDTDDATILAEYVIGIRTTLP